MDEPLTPDEAAEMKSHLRFLFRNRQLLRLKVNAAEDLLLNGAREPTHRGTVVHLLSKVDLAAVTSALTRLADAKQRTQFLAGVVRFSTDAGILLLYLESLHDVASRKEAAAAFGLAIRRIDFATVSPSRMRRVLDLVADAFAGHERVQVVLGLLQSETFRRAFDASREALPDALASTFTPIRVAWEAVIEPPDAAGPKMGSDPIFRQHLRDGVRALLDAPVDVLRSYPEAVRERLLESAMRWADDADLEDRATGALLETLPAESRSFSRLAMLRAQELLRRHDDEAARQLLERTRAAHPTFRMPGKWLDALAAPRVARVGLWGAEDRAGERFRSGFWLDAQRSVWLRVGPSDDPERFVRDALLQRQCAMAGVAPVLECGVTGEGVPYAVLPVAGRPLEPMLRKRDLSEEQALGVALAGVQVLHGLALAGIALPDAEPARFLVVPGEPPQVLLADMGGCERRTAEVVAPAHRDLARSWCAALEAAVRRRESARPFDEGAASLPDLVRALAARA